MIKFDIITSALAGLDEAGISHAIHSSLAWSQAGRLANLTVRQHRITDATDPSYIASPERREQAIVAIERQMEQAESLLSYFARCTSPDLVPSGEDMANLIVEGDRPSEEGQLSVSEFADLLGVSRQEAEELMQQGDQDSAADQQRHKEVADTLRETIARRVNQATQRVLMSEADEAIPDITARRILDKAADKIDVYIDRTKREAARVRRPRRVAKLGARKRILEAAMDRIDDVLERIEEGEADGRPGGSEPTPTDERIADFGDRTPEKEDEA